MAILYNVALPALAGVIAHRWFFIHGEWHMKTPKILGSHLTLGLTVYYILRQADEGSETGSVLSRLAIVVGSYLSALFASIAVYRLYFHPTAHFPGPKLAGLTKFWHVFKIRDSKNHTFLEKIHKQYGDFVRTGPNEITIFHPMGMHVLDGWNNDTIKDDWYDVLRPRYSAIFTRDESEHKERRPAWVQSLATRCMDSIRPRLAEQVQAVASCIAEYKGEPIDVIEMMTWFSFDAMGETVFGQDFDLVKSRKTLPVIDHRDRALALIGPIWGAMWLAHLAFSFLPFYSRVQDWIRLVKFCDERMAVRMARGHDPEKVDMATWFIDEFNALEKTQDLKTRNLLLSGTAVSAIVAGSDTTKASLVALWWYLSKYPEHADKIREEIKHVDVNDANALAHLPHLNGVINEILRLVPPQMTGGGRQAGPSGLVIDGTVIPPYTKVNAPKYVIQRLDTAFPRGNEFIPERWYSRPELIKEKRAFGPFSFGTRQCVGKVLAYVELRLVTAILLQRYNVRFAPGYDPEIMWTEMKDQVTAQPGPVWCVFEPREKEE